MSRKHSPAQKNDNPAFTKREDRRTAYIPVRIRKFKWFPFMAVDCQLIDLTTAGAKLQCGRNLGAKQGDMFWLEISPGTGFESPPLMLEAECRWYNDKDLSLGAAFRSINGQTQEALGSVVEYLKKSGRLKA